MQLVRPLACTYAPRKKTSPHGRSLPIINIIIITLILLLLACFGPYTTRAYAAPQLWLPTPPGEHWKIIQGYACGTHNAWDRYSLDLVSADGKTMGAPVRAAADGTVFVWVPHSGTLILNHGGGFYTMYTHMRSAVTTRLGHAFKRGEVLGAVGDRGAPGTPHLHFTAFTGHGAAASGRRSVPLAFAEGYDLPEVGGCSQHQSKHLVAGDQAGAATPGLAFKTSAEPNRWYNSNVMIEFTGAAAARGFSLAWDSDPSADAPAFVALGLGAANLSEAGEGLHTLHVRAWDATGQQSLASFGPVGYDTTPPQTPPPAEKQTIAANQAATIRWSAALDRASGVAGYRIYLGTDPNGSSEWFAPEPQVSTPELAPGVYTLRLQPLDFAGNAAEWTTVGQVVVTQ